VSREPVSPAGAADRITAEPADREARRAATTDFARNIVVTAGAGTGKTAILVERTLNLVGSGTAALDALALITFTEKAAAELRLRLGAGLDRLLRRAGGDEADLRSRQDADRSWNWLRARGDAPDAIRARVLDALAALDSASVGTIHAFCLDLLRRHPRAAGIDPRAAVGEEASLERLLDQTWDRFLRGADGPAGRAAAWSAAVAAAAAPGPARALGRALARFSLPEAALDPLAAIDARRLLAPLLDPRLAEVVSLRSRACNMAPKMTRLLDEAERQLRAVRETGLTAARRRAIAAGLEEIGARPAAGARLAGATAEEVEDVARRALDLLAALAAVDEEGVAAAHEVARPFARRARRQALARGLVPFDAMLRLARDLLARDAAARRQAAGRFRQILVDEFQDTDPLQYEVLFLLARLETAGSARDATGGAMEDPWLSDLAPGRLFIVGDPKQSNYRFRGADIAAFRRAVDRIRACGGLRLDLQASFRSPDRLLRPINRLFSGWLGPEARDGSEAWTGDHSPPYVPLLSASGPGAISEPPRLSVWSIDTGETAPARAGRRAEAAAIAAHIRSRTAAGGGPRRPGDFAILFRAATHLDLYARALLRAGIPCIVDGARDFAERPETIAFVSWLRAAASPNDGPALLAILRSPLGAVQDREMHRFALAGGSLVPSEGAVVPPDPAAQPALARALERIAAFRRAIAGLSPDAVIRRALDETLLLPLHAAAHDGPERIARLRRCADRARGLAAEGITLPEILAHLEASFAAEEEAGPLADETIDAVRLLTVHKAKGLEFDVVFVPDLGRADQARRAAEAEVAWRQEPDVPGIPAIALPDGRTNAARVLHDLDQARHEEAEERRIFYVACTRAREELILVNSRRDRKAPWRDRLAVFGCAPGPDRAWPATGILLDGEVEHRIVRPREDTAAAPHALDPEAHLAAARRHAAAAHGLASTCRPPVLSPSAGAEERAEPTLDDAGSPERPRDLAAGGERFPRRPAVDPRKVARFGGSAVHAALAACADPRDGAALLAAATSAAGHLAARGPSQPEAEAARVAREIRRILEGFSRSPLPGRLAASSILAREAPILHRDAQGQVWSGTCDLLLRDAEGLVVADYKTDDTEEVDPEAAARVYGAQMRVYADAIRAAFPKDAVRAEILFVRTGRTVRL
jgi:ATP-dependent helicase/nuclease subunit A